jgi:hypothetical protein
VTIISKSIHPRNHYLVDKTCKRGEKVNTAKPRNPGKRGALGKRETVFNARRTAMEATIRNSKQPQAFTMPGTMRGW